MSDDNPNDAGAPAADAKPPTARQRKPLPHGVRSAARVALAELRVKLGSDRAVATALRIDEGRVRRAILYIDVTRPVLAATLRYLGLELEALVARYGSDEAAARLPEGALDWFAWPTEPTPKHFAIIVGMKYSGGIDEDSLLKLVDELEPELGGASTDDWMTAVLRLIRVRHTEPMLQAKATARRVKSQQRRIRKLHDAAREDRDLAPSIRSTPASELVVEAAALATDAERGRFKVGLARQLDRILRCGQHGRPVRQVRVECLAERTVVTFLPCCEAIGEYLRCAVRVAALAES